MKYMSQSDTFQFEEVHFSKGGQSIAILIHEVLMLMKFLQTKAQVTSMNIMYCDLYYTVVTSL